LVYSPPWPKKYYYNFTPKPNLGCRQPPSLERRCPSPIQNTTG
jgi:hypothetical protein